MEWKRRRRGREQEGREGKRENERREEGGVEGRRGVMRENRKSGERRDTHK